MNAYTRLLIRDRLLELAGRPGILPGFRIIAAAPRPPAGADLSEVLAELAAELAAAERS
ncbi:MAG: hypothetical protein HYY95_27635 [Candidatus Rokubacteria bacterium]|nr:hypothetical protein [Candidatus Rokubacteria bacterium]MBI3109301.1 hypothetical protein [Candidatus Rokubacteria bacterium]